METLLAVAVVAGAVLWAARRVRRAVRGAARGTPDCPRCGAAADCAAPCGPDAGRPRAGAPGRS